MAYRISATLQRGYRRQTPTAGLAAHTSRRGYRVASITLSVPQYPSIGILGEREREKKKNNAES